MGHPRISLSLEDIDAMIDEERRLATKHAEEAARLEGFRRLILDIGAPVEEEAANSSALGKGAKNTTPEQGDASLPYRGLGTKVAAIKFLREKGTPQGAAAIADALAAGGKKTRSALFHRTVDNTLSDAAKDERSDLVKIGSRWGLKEWGLEGHTEFVLRMVRDSTVRGVYAGEIKRAALYLGLKDLPANFPDAIIEELKQSRKIKEWDGRYVISKDP